MDDNIIYAISRCLIGEICRYDGCSRTDADADALYKTGRAVLICPECLGGLPTPRPPAEISGGDGSDVLDGRARVINAAGQDVTAQFVSGAYAALDQARRAGASRAVLRAKSPSCGCGVIYDGTFAGALTQGDGVTAALFKRSGIDVETR